MAADGTGNIEHLYSQPGRSIFPVSWLSDGKTILGTIVTTGSANYDIGALLMEGDPAWEPLLHGSNSWVQPRISPDGNWLAYTSNESGQFEVYVRPYPEVDKDRSKVSTSGGNSPLWSPNGRELFYRDGDAIVSVEVEIDPDFKLTSSRTLFRGTYLSPSFGSSTYGPDPWDIHPDGSRFLMIKPTETTESAAETSYKINIVLNWLEELKDRVPVD